ADILHSFQSIRENLEQVELASWMANLIKAFTAEEIQKPSLFQHLLNCLEAIEKKNAPGLLPAYFELHLHKYVGYQPKLDRCIRCQGPLGKDECCFLPSAGGVLCARCGDGSSEPILSPGAVALIQHLLKTDISVLNRLKPSLRQVYEVKEMLNVYDRYLLEKNVNYGKYNPVKTDDSVRSFSKL
ncbi:MAG TPA: DNA repair protein RecO, partial [Nitrospiria bacterium]|nr:DNA repair protein RecO [Nitrospiria bacterium]